MKTPIKLSNTLTAARQGRTGGWVLTEVYTGKKKDGSPSQRSHEYHYGTFQSCVKKACDIEIGTCHTLAEVTTLLNKFTETIKELNK